MSLLKLFNLNKQALETENLEKLSDQDLHKQLTTYEVFAAEYLDQLYYDLKDKHKMAFPEDFTRLTDHIVNTTYFKVCYTAKDIFTRLIFVRDYLTAFNTVNDEYNEIDYFISALQDELNSIASGDNGLVYRRYCEVLRSRRYKNKLKNI